MIAPSCYTILVTVGAEIFINNEFIYGKQSIKPIPQLTFDNLG